ncbi:MAG TPA: 4-alpha-glucanotransferase [Bacteroidales bacterium]|nr:MAG: 4-alpha-glucanotransferase [Bacteroidetes bacterium GWE2_42_24]HBZ67437.1 4-alpha-glucanotransferase [Bacteroidales bacterium]
MKSERSSGILLHVTSLPGKYGIGALGTEAFRFVDWLTSARQHIWQILPLGHTGYGDSPYQCYSAFAGNPMLIDLDTLVQQGYLPEENLPMGIPFASDFIDFETVNHVKWPLLKKAATNFLYQASGNSRQVYNQFCDDEAHWLFDYSLFMAVKEKNELRPWWQWPVEQKLRYQEAIDQLWNELNVNAELYRIIQFFFYSQWLSVKKYANERGIKIIGDIPLYIAHDSADAWCNPSIFMFDGNRNPIWVAGVPPDYFSETGQLWGNPLYNWEVLKSTGFRWWIDRVKANLKLYDIVRIDHFRGLCAYWAVPFGETTAIRGEWINAPGREMLEAIGHELGELNLIAEDLGVITPDVVELREGNNLPGMKILQFAFDSADDNDFRPHTYTRNCIVYTGTHDNDTTAGWYKSAKNEDLQSMRDYFEPDEDHIHWAFIRLAWSTVAGIAIAPAQDILGLGTECRMNLPGKPSGYWRWRLLPGQLTETHANQLARLTRIFGR